LARSIIAEGVDPIINDGRGQLAMTFALAVMPGLDPGIHREKSLGKGQ
jgi:hypothetical protein